MPDLEAVPAPKAPLSPSGLDHFDRRKLLVADTSALLDRPSLQEWKLDGTPWTVVLVPQPHPLTM
jgi:hypothetical protein